MGTSTYSVIVGKRGTITIPSKIRESHEIQEGDVIRITDNGQGQQLVLEIIQTNK